jgi:nicotinamidase-related amidase
MLLELEKSQLVLMDFQSGLIPTMWEHSSILARTICLAKVAAMLDVPTFYTEQNPVRMGATEPALLEVLHAGRSGRLAKMQWSAVEEGLGELLRPEPKPLQGNARSLPKHLQKAVPQAAVRETIVLAGLEAHIALLQTALDLLEDGFDVWVVTDACSARTERSRDAAFDRLASEGAGLVTTEMVVFEWVRTAEHPAFPEIEALVTQMR